MASIAYRQIIFQWLTHANQVISFSSFNSLSLTNSTFVLWPTLECWRSLCQILHMYVAPYTVCMRWHHSLRAQRSCAGVSGVTYAAHMTVGVLKLVLRLFLNVLTSELSVSVHWRDNPNWGNPGTQSLASGIIRASSSWKIKYIRERGMILRIYMELFNITWSYVIMLFLDKKSVSDIMGATSPNSKMITFTATGSSSLLSSAISVAWILMPRHPS